MATKNASNGTPQFFRDLQLSNNELTIRVHALDKSGGKVLIFKDLLKDDVDISITNSWSTGDNPLSRIAKSTHTAFRNAAPVIDYAGKSISEMLSVLGIGKEGFEKFRTAVRDNANSQLITSSDITKQFSGTEVNVPINITGLLYHGDVINGKELNVKQLLNLVLSKCVGNLVDITGEPLGGAAKDKKSQGSSKTESEKDGSTDSGGGITSLINKLIAFQTPPNGYFIQFDTIGTQSPSGTFTIDYGNLYSFRNLVPTSVNIKLSKFRVKTDTNEVLPLYAQLDLQFENALLYTSKDISSFLK